MNKETYFFSYAFPCLFQKLLLKKITNKEYEILKEEYSRDESPKKSELEKLFPSAFQRIKSLAERKGIKNYWNLNLIKEYWAIDGEHNRLIEEKEGEYADLPADFCNLCRIRLAKILNIKGENLLVKIKNEIREVNGIKIKDARIGDYVTVHFHYAIEKKNLSS